MQHIIVDIVSDTICPWCFVGKRRFEAALKALPGVSARVAWRPFFLDAALPASGKDKMAHYNTKFGAPRVAQMLPMMAKVGAAEGIAFDYGGLIANTEASHALIAAAAAHGGAALQDACVEALFQHYFEKQGNIGDEAAISALCAAAGLPAAAAKAALTPAGRAAVRAEERELRATLGISGVPFFVIRRADGAGEPVEISGAAEAPSFVAAIQGLAQK